MRRLPVWITLLPLLLGAALWWWLWQGYAGRFRAQLQPWTGAATVGMGGFPYRLEADVTKPLIRRRSDALDMQLAADEAVINRVPWQADRQVLALVAPRARLAASPLAGARLSLRAPDARASLRLADGHIARLSVVWRAATLGTGLFPGLVRAASLETHVRETPAHKDSAGSPRGPVQAEVEVRGTEVRHGASAPLTLDMRVEVTADAPLVAYAGWAAGGTVEIRDARIADASGEVAVLAATLVPDGAGRLRIAGTITSVCPANVRALLTGGPPVAEQRLRRPVELAFSGTLPGGVTLADIPVRPGAVRGQVPPCPRLG